jgi:hypothetical protein
MAFGKNYSSGWSTGDRDVTALSIKNDVRESSTQVAGHHKVFNNLQAKGTRCPGHALGHRVEVSRVPPLVFGAGATAQRADPIVPIGGQVVPLVVVTLDAVVVPLAVMVFVETPVLAGTVRYELALLSSLLNSRQPL